MEYAKPIEIKCGKKYLVNIIFIIDINKGMHYNIY